MIWLRIFKKSLFLCFVFAMTGCQDEIEENITDNTLFSTQTRNILLHDLYETYKNEPIHTLFYTNDDNNGILNGECVIGLIQFCAGEFGKTIKKSEIIDYFGDKVKYDELGYIIGIELSSQDWDDAFNNWFIAIKPNTQYQLIDNVANGWTTICRLGSQRTHAVYIQGIDQKTHDFYYYDPVLGTSGNKAPFSEIYDPRILKGVRQK